MNGRETMIGLGTPPMSIVPWDAISLDEPERTCIVHEQTWFRARLAAMAALATDRVRVTQQASMEGGHV